MSGGWTPCVHVSAAAGSQETDVLSDRASGVGTVCAAVRSGQSWEGRKTWAHTLSKPHLASAGQRVRGPVSPSCSVSSWPRRWCSPTAPTAQQRVPINECIDARITQGAQIITSERYWEWRFEFTNTRTRDLRVMWHRRSVSDDGWSVGSATTIRPGETYGERGLWSRRDARQRGYADRPPAPLVVWCVGQGFGSGRCYGQNAYRRSSANWNPLGRY